jgi:hypothetical protein
MALEKMSTSNLIDLIKENKTKCVIKKEIKAS